MTPVQKFIFADSVDGVEDLSSIPDEDNTCPVVTVADSIDGVEDLSSIIIVAGNSSSLIKADFVDGVEDLSSISDEYLSSITNKDDTCLAVLLWQTL